MEMNEPARRRRPLCQVARGTLAQSGMTVVPSRLLTVQQTAELLAVKPGTVRLWIGQRRLPMVRLGRSVRVPLAGLQELIVENTVPPCRDDRR
jgi:excisionase family DNA binding protein